MSDEQRQIGPYRILRRIGQGSMGHVYLAQDATEGRSVALKVMAGDLVGDPELVERFRREAVAASSLDHPAITRVYDFGQDGEQLYMAMELLLGEDLKVVLEHKRLTTLEQKLDIMLQVSSAVGFVHGKNLVHRDLKPGNIHVTPESRVKIMDFGLVRLGDSSMTRTGMVMGSPAYMSPEQLRGEKADARSDVFALGSVFYEMLSGQRAFGGKGVTQIMMAVLTSEPAPLAQVVPSLPLPLTRVVHRCLQKDASQRYQTAGEIHAAIEVLCSVYSN